MTRGAFHTLNFVSLFSHGSIKGWGELNILCGEFAFAPLGIIRFNFTRIFGWIDHFALGAFATSAC
jgi:hypothetical protein